MSRSAELVRGLSAGVPVALGYFPVAVTFGVLARQVGLGPVEAVGMSAWVYAGASQFLALRMLQAAASPLQVVAATFVLNFRHFLMGASLSRRLAARRRARAALAYWLTDETFVVASLRLGGESSQPVTAPGFLGLGLLAYGSWIGGTLAGALLSRWLPELVTGSLGIGLYALFIALLVPAARRAWRVALVGAASALTAFALSRLVPGLPPGWALIAATLTAAAVGASLPRRRPAAGTGVDGAGGPAGAAGAAAGGDGACGATGAAGAREPS